MSDLSFTRANPTLRGGGGHRSYRNYIPLQRRIEALEDSNIDSKGYLIAKLQQMISGKSLSPMFKDRLLTVVDNKLA